MKTRPIYSFTHTDYISLKSIQGQMTEVDWREEMREAKGWQRCES
jgi:hypothetical protein